MQPGSDLVLPRGANGMHDSWVDRQSAPYIQLLHPHGRAMQPELPGKERRGAERILPEALGRTRLHLETPARTAGFSPRLQPGITLTTARTLTAIPGDLPQGLSPLSAAPQSQK